MKKIFTLLTSALFCLSTAAISNAEDINKCEKELQDESQQQERLIDTLIESSLDADPSIQQLLKSKVQDADSENNDSANYDSHNDDTHNDGSENYDDQHDDDQHDDENSELDINDEN